MKLHRRVQQFRRCDANNEDNPCHLGFGLTWMKSRKNYCTTPGICVRVGVHTKLYVKVLKVSYFPNHVMYLVYIWYGDRYKSKVLFSNTLNHSQDLKVKVTDLELLC